MGMLRYVCGIITCAVVLAVGAYAPPTYAASASIVITHIQAGGAGAALEEMIILFNNSEEDVDITGWCLSNKSDVAFACFAQSNSNEQLILPAGKFASAVSTAQAMLLSPIEFSVVFQPTNMSSGSITGSADSINLIAADQTIIDTHSWGTSLVGGMLYERKFETTDPLHYLDTDSASDWAVASPSFVPDDEVVRLEGVVDVCSNLIGFQDEVPDGLVSVDGECREPILPLIITELLPNATGSDTGKEFIELYNPNDSDVLLDGYTLLIQDRVYTLPTNTHLAPHAYVSFSNVDLGYSLLNSTSLVMLRYGGELIDQTDAYVDPGEDEAWALINQIWQYTNQPTPGTENLVSVREVSSATQTATTLKPCAANQYRSLETNRCRLIQSPSNEPAPCNEDQYRNPETGRCKRVAVAEEPTPCKEGQERNPETNRCRTVKEITEADYEVLGTETTTDSNGYIWWVVGIVVVLALGYGVWEWRYEIKKFVKRVSGLVHIKK